MFPNIQEPSSLSYASSTTPGKFPYLAVPRHPRTSAQFVQPVQPPAPISNCVALPSQSMTGGQVVLHPVLRYRDRALYPRWDLLRPLEFEGTAEPYLRELATEPGLPSITVVHRLLPWCITVHQSDARGVTVLDVLRAVVSALRVPLEGGRGTRLQLLQGGRFLVGLQRSALGGDVWEIIVV